MLVEAHGPVGGDLLGGIGIEPGEPLQAFDRDTRQLRHIFGGVGLQGLFVVLEADLGQVALAGVLGRFFQGMIRAQAIADIGRGAVEAHMGIDEVPVHLIVGDQIVGDVVEDRQVGLGLKDNAMIGQLEAAMFKGGQYMDLAARPGQTGVGQARPEDGVVLGHVRPPQDEGVGVLEIVVAAHRLVGAEGAHETDHGGGHAMARIRVDVVGAEARLVKFGGGITLVNGPLAGAKHAHPRGDLLRRLALVLLQALLDRGFPFDGHEVEGLVPGDGLEITLLVILAMLLAQQRLGQPVLAIHDFGQEVALDAVQTPIDRRVRITLGGDHAAVLGPDQH